MNIKKISKFLKEERENSNLTQEEVATKIGVSKSLIYKWESGKSYPSMEYLPKLSETYGVSINEIIAGTRLSINEKESAADKNLLEQLERNKVSRLTCQIIFIVSFCTLMVLLEIVWYISGAKSNYIYFIYAIMLFYGLLIELCLNKLK